MHVILILSVYTHMEAEMDITECSPPQRHILCVVQPWPHISPHKLQRCTHLLNPLLDKHAKGLTLQ